MPNVAAYLEQAARPNYLGSYYGIAKELGVAPSYIYRVRDEGGLTDEQCIKLGEIINIHPIEIICARNADKAKEGPAKQFWSQLYDKGLEDYMNLPGLTVSNKDYRK